MSDLSSPARDAASAAAIELIEPGMALGLGSGRAVWRVVERLASEGPPHSSLRVVVASERTADRVRAIGIEPLELDGSLALDLAIDGADEVDPSLRLIKGGGGALLREKIVVSAASRFVVVAETPKRVARLGRGLPAAGGGGAVRLARHPAPPGPRCCPTPSCAWATTGEPYVTDEGALPARLRTGRRRRPGPAGPRAEPGARAWWSTACSSAWPSGRCWARPRATSR